MRENGSLEKLLCKVASKCTHVMEVIPHGLKELHVGLESVVAKAWTIVQCGLGILSAILLHWPSDLCLEIELVDRGWIVTGWLHQVSVVDVGVSQHRLKHIVQHAVVLFDFMCRQQVIDCILSDLGSWLLNSIQENNVKCDLRWIIDMVQALTNG